MEGGKNAHKISMNELLTVMDERERERARQAVRDDEILTSKQKHR